PHNIRVNAIAPGTTDTAQPRYGASEAELIEMARRAVPLGGRMLTPDQIARTAVFLASDDADAITGQVVHVNGGSYMAWFNWNASGNFCVGSRPHRRGACLAGRPDRRRGAQTRGG